MTMKQIDGYDNYYVTDEGQIYNAKTQRFLRATPTSSGYCRVSLSRNGKIHTYYIHRLVAEAFISNPDNKPAINHIDENKANNHKDNLEWVTPKENTNAGTVIARASQTRGKPVLCVETGEIFNSRKEAAQSKGIAYSGDIKECCDNPQRTAKGFHWRAL